jgi:glycosyltransferase involved in cell wall biosynthesis
MTAETSVPALSIVVPVFDEEGNVEPLFRELTAVAAALAQPYEIIFVNDGSRDATLARLQALRAGDAHLRIVDLDGNFGEAAALSAGFAHARGAIVVTLDGDGQNDPHAIPELLARLTAGVDVVSGRRHARKEAFLTRVLPSRLANGLIARLTGVPVHDCGCGLKAYRRAIVAGTQLPRGMNRFLPAILGVPAARVREVWVSDRPRGSGRSHYGLSRTFVVLRDLLALPLLVRRPRGRLLPRAIGGAQLGLVAIAVGAVAAGVGTPAGGGVALVVAVLGLGAALGAWAVNYNVKRWLEAQERGVFRVRSAE